MLTDWESQPIPDAYSCPMSPRHAPEVQFKPTVISARRDPVTDQIILIKITGPRLINGSASSGVFDSWEWDVDRDPGMRWIYDLIKTVRL